MILNKKQTLAIDLLEDKTTKEVEFGGAAGGGKSILGAYYLLKQSIKYPKTRWLMGRAKLKTLKETTLISFFKVATMQGIRANIHFKYNDQNHSINFFNGSVILLKDLFYYPADPEFDQLGSLEITGAFVDENSQLTEKAWNIVRSRIRHGLDENNLIPKILGTCNPTKNFIYNKFYKPYKENTLSSELKFIQSLVTDNPDISKHYIENLKSLDPVSRARLLDGDWEFQNDKSVLMDYEKIVDIFVNTHVAEGKKYISVDVARLGADYTIIRVWSGLRSIHKVKLEKNRIDDLANKIRNLQKEYGVPNSNTIVDEDGVGGGLVDILRCKGFLNNGRPIDTEKTKVNFTNLRSQCYHKLAEIVNANEIYLENETIQDRELIVAELEQIKRKNIESDTEKLNVIGREDIKRNLSRSPDEASCLMMRMYFEIQSNEKRTEHRAIRIKR